MTARALIVAAAAVLLTPPAVQAQTQPHPEDATRLDALDTHFGAALRQALARGARGDVDLLQEALTGPPLPALQTDLTGDWHCRMLRLGGPAGLTRFARFDCRITPDRNGFLFEKLTGSELTKGRISLRAGQMIYLGTGYAKGTDPAPYAELTAGTAPDGPRPQVGLLEQTDPNRARILFPAPFGDGTFDLLFLSR